MASKKRKPKKKRRVVRAWGVFRKGKLIVRPELRVYSNRQDAQWWIDLMGLGTDPLRNGDDVRRVRIEVEP